jgi:hypothetical protein
VFVNNAPVAKLLSSRCMMKGDLIVRYGSWNLYYIVQIRLIAANMLKRSSSRRQSPYPPLMPQSGDTVRIQHV